MSWCGTEQLTYVPCLIVKTANIVTTMGTRKQPDANWNQKRSWKPKKSKNTQPKEPKSEKNIKNERSKESKNKKHRKTENISTPLETLIMFFITTILSPFEIIQVSIDNMVGTILLFLVYLWRKNCAWTSSICANVVNIILLSVSYVISTIPPFPASLWKVRSGSRSSNCIPNCGCAICDPNPSSQPALPPSSQSLPTVRSTRCPYFDLNITIQHLWKCVPKQPENEKYLASKIQAEQKAKITRNASQKSICTPNCGCVTCDPNPPSKLSPTPRLQKTVTVTRSAPCLGFNETIQRLWEKLDRERS